MTAAEWVPDAGDVIWIDLDPRTGHEQSGHRPALVLTPKAYNRKRGLLICCPMTTRIKGNIYEIAIDGKRPSVVLADQVRTIDWRARRASLHSKATPAELANVRNLIASLLEL